MADQEAPEARLRRAPPGVAPQLRKQPPLSLPAPPPPSESPSPPPCLPPAEERKPLGGPRGEPPLPLAAAPDPFTHGFDGARQSLFRCVAPPPYRLQQIVLADDAIAVADQVHQQVEDLRSGRNDRCAAPDFPSVSVDRAVFKQKRHRRSSLKNATMSPFSAAANAAVEAR